MDRRPPTKPPEDGLRARAAAATGLIGGRAVVIFGVGLVANTVLARLLTPADFGIVAIGAALVTTGTFITSGGLGPSLIVRDRPPTADELAAVLGTLLAIAPSSAARGPGV